MGNKNSNGKVKNKDVNEYSKNNRKLKKKKKISYFSISSVAILNYKSKKFIIIGYSNGFIEIYDFINLKLKAKNYDDMKCYEPINYIRELYNGHFFNSWRLYTNIYLLFRKYILML